MGMRALLSLWREPPFADDAVDRVLANDESADAMGLIAATAFDADAGYSGVPLTISGIGSPRLGHGGSGVLIIRRTNQRVVRCRIGGGGSVIDFAREARSPFALGDGLHFGSVRGVDRIGAARQAFLEASEALGERRSTWRSVSEKCGSRWTERE